MKIYFATGNSGKVEDAEEILSGTSYQVEQLDVETVEPSIDSVEEISKEKVRQAVEKEGIEDSMVIADDTGLFLDSFPGFPGPQTAFFDRKVGREHLLDLVDEGEGAEFRNSIALYLPEEDEIRTFTGKVRGEIVKPRGEKGFGYDPMFLPENYDKTFAEDSNHKHQVSHRKKALEKLQQFLEER